MVTTIQISEELRDELKKMKLFPRERYEDVIWGLLEETMELNEETKKDIKKAREEFKQGKTVPFSEVLKKAGLKDV